jgi:hypothetical protein
MKGRSARVIYTQNAPQWLALLAREDLFWRSMRRGFLRHCGFRPVRRTVLAPLKNASQAHREQWLDNVHRLGEGGRGPFTVDGGRMPPNVREQLAAAASFSAGWWVLSARGRR